VDFAERVATLTGGFPRGYGFLADQLNGAALSVATNIAEGNGRFTKADRKHFFTVARASVQECVPLLEIGGQRGLVSDELQTSFRQDLESMAKMITGLIRGLERRRS